MMDIFLTNNLTNKKEQFVPQNKNEVGMYVCGPTVYDDPHIGNARPIVVFDVLYKIFKKKYSKVTYVRNITDVDDKIINASRDEGISVSEITKKYTKQYHSDFKKLFVLPPDIEPFATDHIDQMISFISNLIKSDNAYVSDSHVLFNVSSFPEYGSLSGRKIEDMIPGARIEVAKYKKASSDFCLLYTSPSPRDRTRSRMPSSA